MKTADYEFHELANINPMMNDLEFNSLVNDIKEQGLIENICLFESKILDGRNRYLACLKAGIVPTFYNFVGSYNDAVSFVISKERRRNQNLSQKACTGVLYLPIIEKQNKSIIEENKRLVGIASKKPKKEKEKILKAIIPINNNKEVAEKFGLSERYIIQAKKILKDHPEMFELIHKGIFEITKLNKVLEIKAKNDKLFNDVISLKITIDKAIQQLSKSALNTEMQTADVKKEVITLDELSKLEKNKVNELVSEFNIEVEKAIQFVYRKRKVSKKKSQSSGLNKSLKILLSDDDKLILEKFSKEKGISQSEILRNLIHKLRM